MTDRIHPTPPPDTRRLVTAGITLRATPTGVTGTSRPTTQHRQTTHALTALARTTPSRRRAIAAAATTYLSQVDRHRLPVGYAHPIGDDHANRADAYRMRGGAIMARLLGISCHPTDRHLPDTARAVLAAVDAPVQQLMERATTTGQPLLVAIAHVTLSVSRPAVSR